MNEFVHAYLEIMADPAHMAAELTWFILIDIIILKIWTMVRDRRHGHDKKGKN